MINESGHLILTIYPSFLSRMEFSPKGEKKKILKLVACKKKLGISFQD